MDRAKWRCPVAIIPTPRAGRRRARPERRGGAPAEELSRTARVRDAGAPWVELTGQAGLVAGVASGGGAAGVPDRGHVATPGTSRHLDEAADRSAVAILRRLGAAPWLISQHPRTADGDCGGPHHRPTRWPCHLVELCRAAILDAPGE
jgi:hypothetical protein